MNRSENKLMDLFVGLPERVVDFFKGDMSYNDMGAYTLMFLFFFGFILIGISAMQGFSATTRAITGMLGCSLVVVILIIAVVNGYLFSFN